VIGPEEASFQKESLAFGYARLAQARHRPALAFLGATATTPLFVCNSRLHQCRVVVPDSLSIETVTLGSRSG
jgi:hypothetical protein